MASSKQAHLFTGGAMLLMGLFAFMGTATAVEREKSIIIGQSGQINTLDPLRADIGQTNFPSNALYDTLITYNNDKEIVGRLASEFKVSDDVKSIAITLRPGVKFHDGSTLTAKDVAFTLDRLKKVGIGAASLIEGYDSTQVIDDSHLVINLSKPSAIFLGALSRVYILNSALVQANAGADDGQAWLQSNEAGSGPFKLVDWHAQDVIAERFEDYWDFDAKRPEAMVLRRIDESATKRDEIRVGNIDIALDITDRDVAGMANEPGVKVVLLPSPLQVEVVFNAKSGPTSDPMVRKALRMVYDYEGGMRGIRMGNATIANGPLPSALPCRPDLPPAKRDLDAARQLLEKVGATDLNLTLNFQPAFESFRQEATLLQSNMSEVGVKVDLVPITFPNYLASLKDQKTIPQMMLIYNNAPYPDPGVILNKVYRSNAIGTNRSGYANPEVDKLIDEALRTSDAKKRCDLYIEAQRKIDQDSVVMDMYLVQRPIVVRDGRVTDLQASHIVTPIAPADIRLAK